MNTSDGSFKAHFQRIDHEINLLLLRPGTMRRPNVLQPNRLKSSAMDQYLLVSDHATRLLNIENNIKEAMACLKEKPLQLT
jgi:hypothetical protein